MYEIKCKWCGVILRTDGKVENSHGICEECKKQLLEEVKKYAGKRSNSC